MAKSVRSSVKKRNHANLRSKVFGPMADARTERLSAKLQELAAQPLKLQGAAKDTTGEGNFQPFLTTLADSFHRGYYQGRNGSGRRR
jgi:Protein of unknown function (DUF2423)